ncbi:hypothetical protein F183_A14730 [Bryobacterales bacterium F-183]|nr:hypothetical protein F183_A14730 [Bryobacterales bacterium F-183]
MLRIIAQDPSVLAGDRILTANVPVPVENLEPGPRGYRVHVIDYDSSTQTMYAPQVIAGAEDPFAKASDAVLLGNPGFHAQNVYAIVMRTLAAFEFALGRRVSWAFESHQLQVAPHAFSLANAYYSRYDQALFFGYFGDDPKRPVFTCLSHDVVAHETTHALLDGLRSRYMDPSSIDQMAFHEGFADVIALLSVFSLEEVVEVLLDPTSDGEAKRAAGMISLDRVTTEALYESALLGLGEQMGQAIPGARGNALRRSVALEPRTTILEEAEFREEHRRGEVFVAAMMRSFVEVWRHRIEQLGEVQKGRVNLGRVVEDGAKAAKHLMTMSIRALDYCPPTALTFSQYLSAMLEADAQIQPDDRPYAYREAVRSAFVQYGIVPDTTSWRIGAAQDGRLRYGRVHFESMQRDEDEVFRFIWENRTELKLNLEAYTKVISVRPCIRQSTDGFILRETVAEYVQIVNVTVAELSAALGHPIPDRRDEDQIRLYGGGTLIFNEFGRLKHHAQNPVPDLQHNKDLLMKLLDWGLFDGATSGRFSQMHLKRAATLPLADGMEDQGW